MCVAREMLESSSELSSALLDTMSALTLDTRRLAEVRETVVRTLPSAALSDLPAIVRFILQSACTTADASEVRSLSLSLSHLHLRVHVHVNPYNLQYLVLRSLQTSDST